jgi:hypothetical protein
MRKRSDALWIFVLGLGVGIVLWNIFGLLTPSPAYAQVQGEINGMSSGGLIAVTGLCAQSYSGLWVIDARESGESPSVCLYLPENSGRNGIRFAGARRIKWDMKLVQYKDRTERDMSPGTIRQKWDDMNKQSEKD